MPYFLNPPPNKKRKARPWFLSTNLNGPVSVAIHFDEDHCDSGVTAGMLRSIYILQELHFHWDSEHTVDGRRSVALHRLTKQRFELLIFCGFFLRTPELQAILLSLGWDQSWKWNAIRTQRLNTRTRLGLFNVEKLLNSTTLCGQPKVSIWLFIFKSCVVFHTCKTLCIHVCFNCFQGCNYKISSISLQ